MHATYRALFSIAAVWSMFCAIVIAQDDPGKAMLGQVAVTVYYGTDGDPTVAGERAEEISTLTETRMRSQPQLTFKNYRALGQDTQPVLRSYESWAQPLKPSDEILIKFEARSVPTAELMQLDLELWLSRKKILKTDARLEGNRPLFILGPEWRGGRLIIAVALAQAEKQGSK